jgi:hypothetical protein
MMWSPPEPEDADPLEELTAAAITDRIDSRLVIPTTGFMKHVKEKFTPTGGWPVHHDPEWLDTCNDQYGEDENNPDEYEDGVAIDGWPC